MLLISALLLGTSTYAWFSMNKNVSATGMTISAKSDNVWLVIVEGDTFDATSTATTATSNAAADTLFPCKLKEGVTLTSTNVETPGSWQYAYSNDPTAAAKSGDYVDCTDLTEYQAKETFSIGLSNKSGSNAADNLKLTSVTITANTGISVVVVCGTNAYNHTADAASLTEALATSVDSTGVVVTVYYYINGDDTNVYTNNIATLTGSVTLTFGVD